MSCAPCSSTEATAIRKRVVRAPGPHSKPAGASIDPGTTLLNFAIVMNRLEIAELVSHCIDLFESLPSDINHSDIAFRPFAQRSDGNAQGSPQLGQAIGNVGRYVGLDGTFDQPIAFQAAQCQREHTLRNPGDGPFEVIEPTRPQFEQNDNQNAPFVPNTAQDFGHPIAVFGEAVFSILNHTRVPPVSTTCLLATPPRIIILLGLLINTGRYMNDTWLITGSSVGLGRSIVEAALAAGHNVVATARDPASLDDLASRFPDRLLAQRLDVTDEVRAREVVEADVERFGLIDVLVNNAGFSGVCSIEDMPLDLIEAQFDTNFMGTVHTCKAVLPAMRAQGRGRIIPVSSIGAPRIIVDPPLPGPLSEGKVSVQYRSNGRTPYEACSGPIEAQRRLIVR